WDVPQGKVVFAIIAEPRQGKDEEAKFKATPLIVEALAVRSTGALVDSDHAHFCGILTGVTLRPGPSGDRLIHRAIGIFELPENIGAASTPRPAQPDVPQRHG